MRRILATILMCLPLACLAYGAEKQTCTTADFKGKFGFRIAGTNLVQGQFMFIGLFEVDGAGHITGVGTQALAGLIFRDTPFAGTYEVKPNCTGSVTIDFGNGLPQNLAFVLV